MRTKIVLPLLAGFFLIQSGSAQEVKHASTLMPASTVAYFEVQQISELSKEIAALFKKSALANVPMSLQKYLKKNAGDRIRYDEDFATPALALSPEVLREIGRLGGVAGGITGIVNDDMPEFVVIVDTGKTAVPKFLVRMFFMMEGFGPAGKVEGVTLWSEHGDKDADEVVFAFLKKRIIFGTPKTVAAVVQRAKGKADGKSFADTASYKLAKKDASGEPGFFACADVKNLIAMFDEAVKFQRGKELEILRTIGRLINPKAFQAVVYEVTLKNGALDYRETALLNPNETSPLLELLPTKAVDLQLARYAPKNAMMFAAISNADGASRFKKIIDLADNLAGQFAPNDPPPSAMLGMVEQQLGVSIAKDIVGKINGVAIAMRDPFSIKKNEQGPPAWASMFHAIVQATDAKAAKHLSEKFVPNVFTMMNRGNPVQVDERMVMGKKIHTLSMGPGNSFVLNWALDGKNIIVGADGPALANVLSSAKTNGLLGEAKLAKRLKSVEQPIMIGTMKYFSFLTGIFAYFTAREVRIRQQAVRPKSGFETKFDCGERQRERQNVQQKEPAFLGLLRKLSAKEDPVIFSLTRTKTRLSAQGEMVGLRTFVPAFVNAMVEMYFAERHGRRFGAEDRPRAVPGNSAPPRR